jgi:hypothetical protein
MVVLLPLQTDQMLLAYKLGVFICFAVYIYIYSCYFKEFDPSKSIGWAGWFSRYSDSLWAGRQGDRIRVGARFSAPVQTGSGAHPAFYTTGMGSLSQR